MNPRSHSIIFPVIVKGLLPSLWGNYLYRAKAALKKTFPKEALNELNRLISTSK
jgi:hypothetical protein